MVKKCRIILVYAAIVLIAIVTIENLLIAATRPTGLTAVKKSIGTNRLNWTQVGTEGTYKIYASTVGQIDDSSKSNADIIAYNLDIATTSYDHSVTSRQDTPYWYAVTVATGVKRPIGDWVSVTNDDSHSPEQFKVYWKGGSKIHNIAGTSNLYLFVKNVSGDLSTLTVTIVETNDDNFGNDVKITNYGTITGNWQEFIIPIFDLTNGTGINLTRIERVLFKCDPTAGNTAVYGIDEISFDNLGADSVVFGDDVSPNVYVGADEGTVVQYEVHNSGGVPSSYYEFTLQAGVNSTTSPVSNRVRTKPHGLTVSKLAVGTNLISWTEGGNNGHYIIYHSETGPITEGNYLTAEILESNYNIANSSYKHVITDTADTPHWYAVTVATGAVTAGNWISVTNDDDAATSWGDWFQVAVKNWGTNDIRGEIYLSFYIKKISGDLDALKVFITDAHDNRGNEDNQTISSYVTIGNDWTKVLIPIYDCTNGTGWDASEFSTVVWKRAILPKAVFGIDEIGFVGGSGYLVWGDSNPHNSMWPAAGTQVQWEVHSSGGVSQSFVYPIISGTNASIDAVTNKKYFPPRPNNLVAVTQGIGTNYLSWSDWGTNGTYTIYCSTNGPITDANKSSATILTQGLDVGIHSFTHILSNYYETYVTKKTPFYYAVTVVTPVVGTTQKLTLTTGMVVNEDGAGDAGALVDEQATAGDPPTGACSSVWDAGYGTYPVHAYIDLGQSYHLSTIYLYDGGGSGNVTFSVGAPGNWTTDLFTYDNSGWNTWKEFSVSADSRYVRITGAVHDALSSTAEVCIYGYTAGTSETAIFANINATTYSISNYVYIAEVKPISTLYYPTNCLVTNAKPEFLWSKEPQAATNLIQISSNNFSSIYISHKTTATNYIPSNNLSQGTNYWRVLTRKLSSETWYTSRIAFFIVDTNIPIATLYSPTNLFTTNNRIKFYWSKEVSCDTNWLQISDNNFSSTYFSIKTTATNYLPTFDLHEGTNWWKVLTHKEYSDKYYSSDVKWFVVDRTGPSQVSLLIPSNNKWTNGNPVFKWNSTSDGEGIGVTNYVIEMSSNNFTTINTVNTQTNREFIRILPLSEGQWQWRVFAIDKLGNKGIVSFIWSVNIDKTGPNNITLVSPLDNKWISDNTPQLIWNRGNDGTGIGTGKYIIELTNASIFSKIRYTNIGVNNTNKIVGTQLSDGAWSFRVKAIDSLENDDNKWSSTNTFYIDATPPDTVLLSSPISNIWSTNKRPFFKWISSSDSGSGLTNYIFEIANNIAFSPIYISSIRTTTNYQMGSDLGDGVYYWRVRAVDKVGNESTNSSVWNYKIDTTPPSLSLSNLTTLFTNTVVFNWEASDGTGVGLTNYLLTISSNNITVVSQSISSNEFIATLANGANWEWMVISYDKLGNYTTQTDFFIIKNFELNIEKIVASDGIRSAEITYQGSKFANNLDINLNIYAIGDINTDSEVDFIYGIATMPDENNHIKAVWDNGNWVITIPADSLRFSSAEAKIYFKIKVDGRIINNTGAYYNSWVFTVGHITEQENHVTVLHNVIKKASDESVIVVYNVDKETDVDISVYSVNGELVKRLFFDKLETGTYIKRWDGTNINGEPVGRGIYFMVVKRDGKQTEVRKIMVR